ncbi:MAG: adenosylcobinamide-GDP ribazoletransferase [Pseudomonadota bacterium]
MLQRHAAAFLAAVRFFTRLPVPARVGHSAEQLDQAARWFPAVGWIVGALGAAVTLAAALFWPPQIAVPLGMAATLLVTGAFHEDGLADSIDAFGGGWTRADVLRIMKDSRIGSYGAIGIGMALLTKFMALEELLAVSSDLTFFWVLVAGHAASRFAATTLIHFLAYARDDDSSKSKPLATRLDAGGLAVAALCGLAPCLPLLAALPPPRLAAGLALVALVTLLAARHFVKRIGGYTGDCLGATQQLAEIAFYLGLLCAFG